MSSLKNKNTKQANKTEYIATNIKIILNNLYNREDENYQEFLNSSNISHEEFMQKMELFFSQRNNKINVSHLSSEQKIIMEEIFGKNNNGKFIYLFNIQHGIGGDESVFFMQDYLDMHGKNINDIFKIAKIYNENKKISISQINAGQDYYMELRYKDISFDIFKTMVMLLQEGPNIRVQRQPKNSTQMQTSTILLNTHLFNFNKTENEIKSALLKEKYLIWETFRASGAGGQHVNKTSSAVRLRHAVLGSVNIVSQQERNQIQNKKNALRKLEDEISKEIFLLVKQIISNKESDAKRNIKNTTYNYRRKEIVHWDNFQQTFESIKKDSYREISMQRIIKMY